MMRRVLTVLMMLAVVVVLGVAADSPHRPVAETPAWKSLQTLVGKWDGKVTMEGKELTSHLELRMTGDGSALMHWMDQGTKHEMVTMFHPDLNDLMATHYCAGHNQPRMKMVSATPQRIVFDFKDGTNIGPKDGHMAGVTIVLIDANHHDEEWSYEQDGKRSTTVFHYTKTASN